MHEANAGTIQTTHPKGESLAGGKFIENIKFEMNHRRRLHEANAGTNRQHSEEMLLA